jgi:hypothetical protein
MPTIRIHDWTKAELDEVRDQEDHSSYDSVIKALLRDHELARHATSQDQPVAVEREDQQDSKFNNLTALAELSAAESGVMFLWCPNCGNEVSHIMAEGQVSFSVFEIQCQQCLSQLNHHAIVVVEIGYNVEEQLVEEALTENLRACIVDYWDRTLERISDGTVEEGADEEYLVWQFAQYYREFDWEWPEDVPVVGLQPGEIYRNEGTGTFLECIEPATDHNNQLNAFHVEAWSKDTARSDSSTEITQKDEVMHLLVDRALHLYQK